MAGVRAGAADPDSFWRFETEFSPGRGAPGPGPAQRTRNVRPLVCAAQGP